MTEKEAIKRLSGIRDSEYIIGAGLKRIKFNEKAIEAFDLAISALEKQIPKNPKRIDKNATFDGNWKKVCPACGRVLVERITTPDKSYPRIYNHTPHCICGQAIDWSEPYTEEEA